MQPAQGAFSILYKATLVILPENWYTYIQVKGSKRHSPLSEGGYVFGFVIPYAAAFRSLTRALRLLPRRKDLLR